MDSFYTFYIYTFTDMIVFFLTPRLTGYAVHPVQLFKILASK